MPGARSAGTIALLPLALALSPPAARAAIDPCSPLSFGAVADGVTDNTAAIQSAIDACANAGGGPVRLPLVRGKGTYLTGPITLVSHVKLQIDKGVILRGTTDHARYRAAFLNYPYHANEALVSAYRAVETGIIGPGTIDGQGGAPAPGGRPSWWNLTQPSGATIDGTTWYAPPYADVPISNGVPRPWLVEFYQCRNVTVNDITLTNAPMWNLVLRYSSQITVSEYTATVTPDPSIPHTDGIDLVGSHNATLLFLHIGTGGDSIALESGLPLNVPLTHDPNEAGLPRLSTHDVQIANSTISHGNGIVLGSEAANGVYNVVARNIVEQYTAYGLLIKSSRTRGNHATGIYNIIAQNLTLANTRQPLVISAYDPPIGGPAEPPYDPPHPITPLTPNIHDITISGLAATGAMAESSIVGLPESCIRNVNLANVSITGRNARLRLRNMTGAFTNVAGTLSDQQPPLMVQQNVTLTTAATRPPVTAGTWPPVTAGTAPPRTNTPALGSQAIPPDVPCDRNPNK
ncbi:MAG TPA: glycosyl hydrolase family 28 protein [Acetobacteraceae bacterium]|nr:glycosyl hydrolase family 28 protein [Acetobacteraceae bacterium]